MKYQYWKRKIIRTLFISISSICLVFSNMHIPSIYAETSFINEKNKLKIANNDLMKKPGTYVGALIPKKDIDMAYKGYIYYVKIKNNKLTLKGRLTERIEKNRYENEYKLLKQRKYTFRMTPNCKMMSYSGESSDTLNKKEFLELAHCYNGLAFFIRVNYKGFVDKLSINS